MASGAGISRRNFAKGAATVGAVAAAGSSLVWVMGDGSRASAFALDHAADVYVWIGQGEEFTVRVHRRDGTLLERFDRQTARSLTRIDSDLVSFRTAAAPAAA